MDTHAPAAGHNLPPLDADPLRDRLAEENAALLARRDELLAAIERSPEIVEDDETAGKMGDFSQKQIAGWLKDWEGRRVAEKEPFLSAGRTVDGFFHKEADPLAKGKQKIDARRKKYLDAKAEAERRARIEAERIAREAAEKAAREAAEAERKARDERDLAAALAAEEAAKKAAAEAEKARAAAAAKPAELSRVRGEYGSVSSLKQFWAYRNLDRGALDLNALREHLPADALDKAIKSFIRAGGRKLAGCEIFEDTRL